MWLTCSRERGTGEKAKDYPDVGRLRHIQMFAGCRKKQQRQWAAKEVSAAGGLESIKRLQTSEQYGPLAILMLYSEVLVEEQAPRD